MSLPILYRDHLRWTRHVRIRSGLLRLMLASQALQASCARTAEDSAELGIALHKLGNKAETL